MAPDGNHGGNVPSGSNATPNDPPAAGSTPATAATEALPAGTAALVAALVAALQQNASAPREREAKEPDVEGPDFFKGDKKKCEQYLAGCRTVFEAQPRRYATDHSKILYMGSRMQAPARAWFDITIRIEAESRPEWFKTYEGFVKEFRRVHGLKDPAAAARTSLHNLRMKDENASNYIQRFQQLVYELSSLEEGWDIDSRPLGSSFFEGLSPSIKDEYHRSIPPSEHDYSGAQRKPFKTTELMLRIQDIANRLSERSDAVDTNRAPKAGGRNKQGSSPSTTAPTESAKTEGKRLDKGRNVSGGVKRWWNAAEGGGPNQEEIDLRKRYGECMRCGDPDHPTDACSGNGRRA